MAFEIGIMTFGEMTEDPATGRLPSPRQRVRETIEQAKVADEVDLDVFGVGEHHRSDFVGWAPTILLAAAAEATERIRLTSSVTVLSSEDPVRVWEPFATIDLLSSGRARSWRVVAPTPSPSRFSATTWTTTRASFAKRSTCCSRSAPRTRSPGRDVSAP